MGKKKQTLLEIMEYICFFFRDFRMSIMHLSPGVDFHQVSRLFDTHPILNPSPLTQEIRTFFAIRLQRWSSYGYYQHLVDHIGTF